MLVEKEFPDEKRKKHLARQDRSCRAIRVLLPTKPREVRPHGQRRGAIECGCAQAQKHGSVQTGWSDTLFVKVKTGADTWISWRWRSSWPDVEMFLLAVGTCRSRPGYPDFAC